jgi:hypothetical protein
MGSALAGQLGGRQAPMGAWLGRLRCRPGFGAHRGLGVLADRRGVAKHAVHGGRNTTALLGLCQMRP